MAAPQNQRQFSSGICDCFSDCKSCLCGYFCAPCLGCKTAGRLGENSCCVGYCLAPMTWMAMRTKLRVLYGISGSICNDCLATTFCPFCVLCQLDRELTHVGL